MKVTSVVFMVVLASCSDSGSSLDAGAGTNDALGPAGADAAIPIGSAGCGASASGGVTTQNIDVRGVSRTYELAIPTGYNPATPYALVFAWHGLGSFGSQARAYFGVEEAAGGAAIVVYPNGLPQASLQNRTGWNLSTSGEDVELFDKILEQVEATLCIDSSRVFSTGHSFGGYMSNVLGCARSQVIAAIAPVAGGGPYASSCTNPVPALLVHGSADATVPISEGTTSRDFWRGVNGCTGDGADVPPSPCVAYNGCDANPVVWCQHAEIAFNGHGWPSFTAGAIWGFFSAR